MDREKRRSDTFLRKPMTVRQFSYLSFSIMPISIVLRVPFHRRLGEKEEEALVPPELFSPPSSGLSIYSCPGKVFVFLQSADTQRSRTYFQAS